MQIELGPEVQRHLSRSIGVVDGGSRYTVTAACSRVRFPKIHLLDFARVCPVIFARIRPVIRRSFTRRQTAAPRSPEGNHASAACLLSGSGRPRIDAVGIMRVEQSGIVARRRPHCGLAQALTRPPALGCRRALGRHARMLRQALRRIGERSLPSLKGYQGLSSRFSNQRRSASN
jgi:hypothetical protein